MVVWHVSSQTANSGTLELVAVAQNVLSFDGVYTKKEANGREGRRIIEIIVRKRCQKK